MCRQATPKEKQVLCSRCKQVANPTDGWEHDWPLYGNMSIGFPAQIFAALCGTPIADEEHFELWREKHPAFIEHYAQSVKIEWGSDKPYRLCYDCQQQLLGIIGEFFGLPQRAAEIKANMESG